MILPVELCHAVIDFVSSPCDLANLRAANKLFCRIATPRTFYSIAIPTSITSCDSRLLRTVQDLKHLRPYVQEIVFLYNSGNRAPSHRQEYCSEQLDDPCVDETVDELSDVLTRLNCFPSLKSLCLDFCPHSDSNIRDAPCYVEHFCYQYMVIQAIATHPIRTLTSLNIKHLVPVPDSLDDDPDFFSSFSGLDSLSIEVIANPTFWHYEPQNVLDSWTSYPPSVLANHLNSLSSLTLLSDILVGFDPPVDLSRISYPALTHLTLKHFIFGETSNIEEFILRHEPTLQSLTLDLCSIGVPAGQDGPCRFWSDIFKRFSDRLVNLVEIVVRYPGVADVSSLQPDIASGYFRLGAMQPVGEGAAVEPLVGSDVGSKDQDRLQKLMKVAETRRIQRVFE